MIEYFGEIATKLENILTYLSDGPDGIEKWKKKKFENLMTHSLKTNLG